MNPTETYAVVVGIEKYRAGGDWNLNGPAVDAARFVRWLRSRGVPATNISLFADPLDCNRPELDALDVGYRAADSTTIVDALGQEVPKKRGELMIFFWGGHGVIGGDIRRLFYSDVAPNLLRNCPFDQLLRYCRSLTGFARQAFIVDACANYFELMQSPEGLADIALPNGLPDPTVRQFVLFGASAGERAMNFGASRTGAFAGCLLHELQASPAAEWPPDFAAVRAQLESAMLTLRAEGRADQTPVSYTYSDWQGNAGTFRDVSSQIRAVETVGITLEQRDLLVDALLDCAAMLNAAHRDSIVADLRADIANSIERNPANRLDVIAIVRTAARYPGGLAELIHRVRANEGKSLAAQALTELARRLRIAKT